MKRLLCALGVAWLAPGAHGAGAPFLVAHRGASHDAPENTLPAFLLAWQQGADAIEGDFRLTSDRRIVCIHDPDTQRVTGVRKEVRRASLAELRELDAGAWFKPEWRGTRLPTFAEVAATVPAGRKFYVEIKCGSEILPVLLDELAATALTAEQVVVISFHSAVIRDLKAKAPQFKAFWLSSFAKGDPLDPSPAKVLATLADTGADGFSSSADRRVDAAFVGAILAAGHDYHAWTIDDPAVARRFIALGARSITTNRPGWLRKALAAGAR